MIKIYRITKENSSAISKWAKIPNKHINFYFLVEGKLERQAVISKISEKVVTVNGEQLQKELEVIIGVEYEIRRDK